MTTPCVGIEGPCRETLQLMPPGTSTVMYALFAGALGVVGFGFWMKIQSYRRGGKEVAWDHPFERLRRLVTLGLLQARTARKKYAGPMHQMIYWGFLVLFLGTLLVLLEYDFTLPVFHYQFLVGNFYLVFEFLLDLFGILFLVGLGMAIRRRLLDRPEALHNKFQDAWNLTLLAVIGLQGFALEALRLSIRQPAWAGFSFAGQALSHLFNPLAPTTRLSLYGFTWWFHAVLVFVWIAAIPYTKMQHVFTAPANILFGSSGVQLHKGELSKPFDLQKALETGDLDLKLGVQKLEDFTWRQLLSLDACTECGRCQEVCPAYAAGRPLSPMKLVLDLRAEMQSQAGARWGSDGSSAAPPAPGTGANALVDAVIRDQTLWSCVTCRACMEACPVMIEHVPLIVDLRRGLVMESRLDGQKTRLLTNLANTGNAYGFPSSDRDAWAEGLEIPRLAEVGDASKLDVLYWVGCSGSYDSRNQKVSRALVRILRAAGVRFAILGKDEKCTGDPARRLGEESRYQEIVMHNVEILKRHNVRKVLTQCPHCFNTLRNEYRRFGIELDVEHHSRFIARLLADGRLKTAKPLPEGVTYHDPCYLGRYNDEYEPARQLLQITTGKPALEMHRHRSNSFCCGAGGSNMWFEVKEERERMSHIRMKEARATGAKKMATACPFCMTMFDDAARVSGDDDFQVKDLAEIVAENLVGPG